MTDGAPGTWSEKTGRLTAMLSATPTTTPPTNAPGRLVIPPSTAAVKAGISAESVTNPAPNPLASGAERIPPSPPRMAATPQVKRDSRSALMPISSVASGFWLRPRMARPRSVRAKNRAPATASATRVARINRRWSETAKPNTDTRSSRPSAGGRKRSWPSPSHSSVPMAKSDTPAVATSSVTRGAANSGSDDEPLGGQPAGQSRHERQRAWPAPYGHTDRVGAPQGEDGDRAELALGEVEDAARLVDEHEPERDQPVTRAGDDAR